MKTLTFKVSDDEAKRIRSMARREGVSVSEYLRSRAQIETVCPPPTPAMVRCDKTGAVIFDRLGEDSKLTSAEVRELLSDFP